MQTFYTLVLKKLHHTDYFLKLTTRGKPLVCNLFFLNPPHLKNPPKKTPAFFKHPVQYWVNTH